MTSLVLRGQLFGARDAGRLADEFLRRGGAGNRIVAFALAFKDPQRHHIELALSGISPTNTPFEQYHALLLTSVLLPKLDSSAAGLVREALLREVGNSITKDDNSRW